MSSRRFPGITGFIKEDGSCCFRHCCSDRFIFGVWVDCGKVAVIKRRYVAGWLMVAMGFYVGYGRLVPACAQKDGSMLRFEKSRIGTVTYEAGVRHVPADPL